MGHVGLDESQTGIKIARRNITGLRYADDTTLMAESKEELKSLLMRGPAASSTSRAVRQQSDRAAWAGPGSVLARGGPGSRGLGLSSRRPWLWLVVALAAVVGTVSQTTQPGESLWTEAS